MTSLESSHQVIQCPLLQPLLNARLKLKAQCQWWASSKPFLELQQHLGLEVHTKTHSRTHLPRIYLQTYPIALQKRASLKSVKIITRAHMGAHLEELPTLTKVAYSQVSHLCLLAVETSIWLLGSFRPLEVTRWVRIRKVGFSGGFLTSRDTHTCLKQPQTSWWRS